MTDQYRATPEDWEYIRLRAEDGVLPSNCILELRDRIEALEAAQQDKLDRLIALDAADPTPDPAMAELRAASAEARPDVGVKQSFVPPHALVDKWFDDARALSSTPLGVTRKVAEWAAQWGAAQLADPAPSAEAQPAGGLVERVAEGIAAADDEGLTNMTWNYHARAAIREVATWLDRFALHGSGEYAQAAKVLRQEANHG
jgi:hypothetical protein